MAESNVGSATNRSAALSGFFRRRIDAGFLGDRGCAGPDSDFLMATLARPGGVVSNCSRIAAVFDERGLHLRIVISEAARHAATNSIRIFRFRRRRIWCRRNSFFNFSPTAGGALCGALALTRGSAADNWLSC